MGRPTSYVQHRDAISVTMKSVANDSPPDPLRWDYDWQATSQPSLEALASTDPASVERTTGKLDSHSAVPATDSGSVEGDEDHNAAHVAVQSLHPPARGRWRGNAVTVSRSALIVLFACAFLSFLAAAARASDRYDPNAQNRSTSLVAVEYVQPADEDQPDLIVDPLAELEQLLQTPVIAPALGQEVTSVSRQESTVGKSPAAVFVITNEMIRRSGATNIPEALRIAPGVIVARIDSNKWAIGIRGLNARFNRNLLVQIDGRTVYTPLFAGTYWDVQDLILQDIERIEVIRGPGATVWGVNAVNGVINIITKQAKDTQGALAFAGGGANEPNFTGVRYGGQRGDDLHYRVWGKWYDKGPGYDTALPLEPAGDPNDAWRQMRGGFRMDWRPTECDYITLQGDIYDDNSNGGPASRIPSPNPNADPRFNFRQPLRDQDHAYGGDILTRWTHKINDESSWACQFYYDRTVRDAQLFGYTLDTIDFDFQWSFPLAERHKLIWGAGYRLYSDEFRPGVSVGVTPIEMNPRKRVFDIVNTFLQDEITLVEDRLYFTIGSKLSVDDFSDFQVQPTARLLWAPTNRQSVWGAVSRAVRTPARTNHDITFVQPGTPGGLFPTVLGNPNFDAEVLIAYELGYRAQPTDAFSWDIALFFNDYSGLQVQELGTVNSPTLPLLTGNGMDGETYGVELTATYQMTECWRLYGAYSFLQVQLHRDANVAFAGDPELAEGQSPQNQLYLQSSWDLGCNLEFDLMGRYVDRLTGFGGKPDVKSFIELDARLAYRPSCCWEFAVVGQNLLHSHHREFHDSLIPGTEVQRGVYGMVTYER